jgi:hypothetical protein
LNRRSQAKLFGAIRLVPRVDTIGIPLFSAGNGMFVPEMDAEFRITRFLDFFNEDGYTLDYELPKEYQGRIFSIGSPTPIPFWFSQTRHIIEGDAEREDLAKKFGCRAADESVLIDLGNLLDDARTGRLRQRKERWTADEIAAGFGDVFYEVPVHSPYWVRRYNVAVANARAIAQPPHPIDIRLRRVALEWIRRFATKTDFTRLVAVLGKAEDGIITSKRRTEILFAFLVHKTATGNFGQLAKYLDHPLIQDCFPFGLCYYFEKSGWPKVPFDYQRPANNLIHLLIDEIKIARRTQRFDRAAQITYLFYNRTHVPRLVDDHVMPILNESTDRFHEMRERAQDIFGDREFAHQWRETAESLLQQYDQLMVLDGMLNGDARLSKTVVDRRFGVDAHYINELRRFLKEH